MILGLLLAACAPATEETPVEEQPAATDEPAATEEPTAEPTEEAPSTERHGGWLRMRSSFRWFSQFGGIAIGSRCDRFLFLQLVFEQPSADQRRRVELHPVLWRQLWHQPEPGNIR